MSFETALAESTAATLYQGIPAADFSRWQQRARTVADELARTIITRDKANQDPHAEIELLRGEGLLGLAVPRALGGAGASLLQAMEIVRIISEADGSIGQLLAYHYSNGVWTWILGTPEQWEDTVRHVAQDGWFQGGVSNPRDQWAEIERDGDRRFISGKRTFATGTAISQIITVSLWDQGKRVHYQIPTNRPGITFGDDWDNLGQRLTASGSVTFERVELFEHERLSGLDHWPADANQRDGLRPLFSQIIFAHFYLGIAEGALKAAESYVRHHGRPWPESGVSSALEDPYNLAILGRFSAAIEAGVALADKATVSYQQALFAGAALSAEAWGQLAILVDQAKVVANDVVLEVTSRIYEVTGGRSTANRHGLDHFWRNARTHSVHDPVSYRAREIGQARLDRSWPKPRVYTEPPKAQ
ncbi:acyl-CoA dehydrogenase family protein [Kerstersia gyiorum]|jgi:alkylation response protein AidB-like acyl-CoA dehydrogenase|uniref:acyl-CoA dehydrogenase family protein n=1 Tax=Kerstersia gyiorum TaxID=206506 RepID=UPI00242BD62E|nr:acyl-CoA dehydrogenase family protein [Kerstersia gyiorum]MCH4271800.1 acyl-CoA dehydrogenase family protein [Kerstersia gyiorum]MCI1227628.1 acyl-CoA dehydrogenase family protein [Kerstersia gyiorum]